MALDMLEAFVEQGSLVVARNWVDGKASAGDVLGNTLADELEHVAVLDSDFPRYVDHHKDQKNLQNHRSQSILGPPPNCLCCHCSAIFSVS